MRKYQIIFTQSNAENRVYVYNFTVISVLVLSLILSLVVATFGWIHMKRYGLKKEIAYLQSVEVVNLVDKNLVIYQINEIHNSIKSIADNDEFVKEILPIPIISSHFNLASFTAPYTSPESITYLLSLLEEGRDTVDVTQLSRVASLVSNELNIRTDSQNRVLKYLQEQEIIYAHTPTIWPTVRIVSSAFGFRKSPFTNLPTFHEGVDFAASWGTPNRSAADGVVVFAGTRSGYGYLVTVDHGFGFLTRYAHNSKLLVKEGDFVKKGDIVALAGSTGRSTGAHLHYEVLYNGAPVNSYKFIPRN